MTSVRLSSGPIVRVNTVSIVRRSIGTSAHYPRRKSEVARLGAQFSVWGCPRSHYISII